MVRKISKKNMANLIESNYGSIYKSSGGGKLSVGKQNVKTFLKKILGNRVLDLYLKYGGIKTLTTATLVPMALILGKQTLESMMNKQVGGGTKIPKNIPILDDPLVGSYLKLMGVSVLNLKLNTLVPLGVVMIAYDLFVKNTQKGGGSSILGESIPPNLLQGVGSVLSGNTPSLITSTNYSITDNALGVMQCSDGSCGVNQHTSHIVESGVSPEIIIKGIGTPDKIVTNTFSAKYNDPQAIKIPHSMAGGGNHDNTYNFIQHPTNRRKYSLKSKMGQSILKKYLKNN
tara:strand:+ start:6882 stop:7742 length:861 start_codon:yes stop_codon:yes gene_type:complete